MATYTENYNLKMPSGQDAPDVEDFNANAEIIDTVLKAHSDNTADEYSPDETYTAGRLVIQNNALWKAKQDINVAEAWTPEHWEGTTLAAEFSALNSRMAAFPDFNNVLKSTFDVNETWEATANCWIIGYLQYDESQSNYDTNITQNGNIIASCYSASGRLYTPVCFPLKIGTSIRTSEAGTFAIRAYACES